MCWHSYLRVERAAVGRVNPLYADPNPLSRRASAISWSCTDPPSTYSTDALSCAEARASIPLADRSASDEKTHTLLPDRSIHATRAPSSVATLEPAVRVRSALRVGPRQYATIVVGRVGGGEHDDSGGFGHPKSIDRAGEAKLRAPKPFDEVATTNLAHIFETGQDAIQTGEPSGDPFGKNDVACDDSVAVKKCVDRCDRTFLCGRCPCAKALNEIPTSGGVRRCCSGKPATSGALRLRSMSYASALSGDT